MAKVPVNPSRKVGLATPTRKYQDGGRIGTLVENAMEGIRKQFTQRPQEAETSPYFTNIWDYASVNTDRSGAGLIFNFPLEVLQELVTGSPTPRQHQQARTGRERKALAGLPGTLPGIARKSGGLVSKRTTRKNTKRRRSN
jgi:hypothetical protein